jgi:hypothetical protein
MRDAQFYTACVFFQVITLCRSGIDIFGIEISQSSRPCRWQLGNAPDSMKGPDDGPLLCIKILDLYG